MKRPSKYVRERMALKNRPRKVLNLEERVQAIHMYDHNPVYQRVASVFQCSWEQIKNVICNRDDILQYYARCQTIDGNDNPRLVRQKKINFLGNVMFEYIKRAYYHRSATLTDDSIRARALEFRDIIKIDKFYPNKAWVNDFKHVYSIDLQRLNTIVITQVPLKSLNCKDITAYCTKEVARVSEKRTGNEQIHLPNDAEGYGTIDLDDGDDDDDDDEEVDANDVVNESGDVLYFGDADDDINEDEEGPTIDYGDYDYNEDEVAVTDTDIKPIVTADAEAIENTKLRRNSATSATAVAAASPKIIKVESHSNNNSPMPSTSFLAKETDTAKNSLQTELSTDTKQIANYAAAIQQLRPLEDFAIAEEDFHAINLLSQLAEVYEKAIKRRKIK